VRVVTLIKKLDLQEQKVVILTNRTIIIWHDRINSFLSRFYNSGRIQAKQGTQSQLTGIYSGKMDEITFWKASEYM
jgi:hypothetical protein